MFYKGEVPFVRLLIPLVIGILTGNYFARPFILQWRTIACLLIFGVFFIVLYNYKKHSLYREGWLFGLIIHVYLLITGYGLSVYVSERFEPTHYSFSVADMLIVKIENEPQLLNGILRFEAEVVRTYLNKKFQTASGKLILAMKSDTTVSIDLKYGDVLLIPAIYNEIEPSFNPGEFDYKSFLEDRQIYFQTFISPDQVRILNRNAGNPVIAYALELRMGLVRKFNIYLPGKEAAAMASALILGYRADLNKELIEAYSTTGTMHVLSVSGMHVGIVFLVLSFLLKPMNRNRKLILFRAFLIVSVIWFYSLLTGFSAPVCRAALMISFVVFGKALNKNQNTYNLIAISAFFLLLYNPFFIMDVGFQLSYLAVTGLVYFHSKIYHIFYFKNIVTDLAWSYCALSIAAQLATFPVSLYYFHQFPVYFLLSNLLIVLPVAIIMYAGILFMLMPFVFIIKPLGYFLNWIINLNNTILYIIESFPYSGLTGLWINSFQFFLICSLLGLYILWSSFKFRYILFQSLIIILILIASISFKSITDLRRHELIFFSLKKNTALAYLYKGHSVLITDLDPRDKVISYSIQPALDSRGNPKSSFFGTEERSSGYSYWFDSNFMQFGDYRILRWNKTFENLTITRKLKVNAVLLSGNPSCKLSEIRECVNFETILFDGTNSDYKIRGWLMEAGKLNVRCYILKKYPAYIVKL